jgi:hypothetical protein
MNGEGLRLQLWFVFNSVFFHVRKFLSSLQYAMDSQSIIIITRTSEHTWIEGEGIIQVAFCDASYEFICSGRRLVKHIAVLILM